MTEISNDVISRGQDIPSISYVPDRSSVTLSCNSIIQPIDNRNSTPHAARFLHNQHPVYVSNVVSLNQQMFNELQIRTAASM